MSEPAPLPDAIRFADPCRAQRFYAAAVERLPQAGDRLAALLSRSPDPSAGLETLDRFLDLGPQAAELIDTPRRLDAALTVFAHSRFLSDTLLRYPELLPWALSAEQFDRIPAAEELRGELGAIRPDADDAEAALHLARFKRMQLLRIAVRDLMGAADVAVTTLELSNLADALIEGARDHIRRRLEQRFGRPLLHVGGSILEGRFVVLALGKLGGRELNYSSDIDLIYLHTGGGETAGPVRTSNRDFFNQLAERLTALLSQMTPEGFAYRVDLRLRPEGGAGELVPPLDGAVHYYNNRARDWELQMLIKARPAAGDMRLGREFLRLVQPLIYRTSTDFSTIEKVAESRDRIQKKLRSKTRAPERVDVKLQPGGIRDVEFLVQCMQRLYGGADPFVRSGGTLFALHRLHEKGYVSMRDYSRLAAAYQYLRTLEHRLQLVDNRQTHEIPTRQEELEILAERMSAAARGGPSDMKGALKAHFRQVRAIYDRVVRSQEPTEIIPDGESEAAVLDLPEADHSWRTTLRHLERRSPALAAALATLPIRRGGEAFGHFLDRIAETPPVLDAFAENPDLLRCTADLIEHSAYLGAQLARYPLDVLELEDVAGVSGTADPSGDPDRRLQSLDDHPEAAPLFDTAVSANEKSMLLRRIYRKRMLRLLADSAHQGRPIFTSLARTSDIADWVIRSAYRIALEEMGSHGSLRAPDSRLQVVALGRLGMREFDLGSDADLAYILPDEARGDAPWWTQFAAHMTDVISSYTTEGMIFSVDARLRPRGRDGDLIQTESAFRSYFENGAEAWEALAYLKARAVAGDVPRGTRLLAELQQIGWRRFALSGDSAPLLTEMRRKIEQEQGAKNPLKAGVGGYYDIDFILLYLRLKGSGSFFEYLSTPQRIEVIRADGRLGDDEADALMQAATFYRALDHAIRTATGQSSGVVPPALPLQETILELLRRWSAVPTTAQPLPSLVADMRQRTRAMYRKVFEA